MMNAGILRSWEELLLTVIIRAKKLFPVFLFRKSVRKRSGNLFLRGDPVIHLLLRWSRL